MVDAAYRREQQAAMKLVIDTQFGSAKQLQRVLGVSQVRAALLMLDLEENGIVGMAPGPGLCRPVLVAHPGPVALGALIESVFPADDWADD